VKKTIGARGRSRDTGGAISGRMRGTSFVEELGEASMVQVVYTKDERVRRSG